MRRQIPESSKEAFQFCIESGYASAKEAQVIAWLVKYKNHQQAPFTTKEFIEWVVNKETGKQSWTEVQDVQKSISSLKKKGAIEYLEMRPCRVSTTKRRAHPIALTGYLPEKIKKPKPKKITRTEFKQWVHSRHPFAPTLDEIYDFLNGDTHKDEVGFEIKVGCAEQLGLNE